MAIFVSDSFTDTAGTVLESHTGETGASWTPHPSFTAGFVITDANRCRPNVSGSILAAYASGVPAGADYEVSVDIVTQTVVNGAQFGVYARMDPIANTSYRFRHVSSGSSTMQLHSTVAGTTTQLGSVGFSSPPSGGVMALKCEGDQITASFAGSAVFGPLTDTDITAGGRAGLYAFTAVTNSTGFHFDNLTATDIAAAGTTVEPQDSTQGHTVAAPGLTQAHSLTVVSSTQGHTATSPDVQPTAAGVTINIVSATNGHTVSAPDITVNSTLVIVGSTAGHTATPPALVQTHVVSIVSATNGHVTTPPAIGGTSLGTITIVSVTMGHTVSAPSVTTFSLGTTPVERTFTVANENRDLSIAAESRNLVA